MTSTPLNQLSVCAIADGVARGTFSAEEVVREAAQEYGKVHPGKDGKPREVLESLTTFVGGGGPRFWFSVAPELQQLNYVQCL